MSDPPDKRDSKADFEEHVNKFLVEELVKKMPFRLVDTYTGRILGRWEVALFLKKSNDYNERLEAAVSEASGLPNINDPCPNPKFKALKTFVKDHLAFVMFSHRWRGREVTIKDVRNPIYSGGIYTIDHPPPDLPAKKCNKFKSNAKKLQEFCCTAAKCGYRWAWADTCCIDEENFGEKSESLNSMFLWYHSSDLTIVYLDDVQDVVKHFRLKPVGGYRFLDDPVVQDPITPMLDDVPEDHMTLYKRCQNHSSSLESSRPDTQVETTVLEAHLDTNFPLVPDDKACRRHTKVPEWVTRAWTLQEALASKRLRIYSQQWTLLEDARDNGIDEEEEDPTRVTSFMHRARLQDHRRNSIWFKALNNTTHIGWEDLVEFKPGPTDVRKRLGWVARRRATKDEDMAYCLLGIFDVTLPAFYGEGHRAFFRLQEEIMKRTGDVSVFDWRGRSSHINSFLAYEPACFTEPEIPLPHFDYDSNTSPFKLIPDICAMCRTPSAAAMAVTLGTANSIEDVTKSRPVGHTFINGELNVSMFEYQIHSCKVLDNSTSDDGFHHYKLEADGLAPTMVVLSTHAPTLVEDPTQYYLCRVWNRDFHNVFNILHELWRYALKDARNETWDKMSGGDDEEFQRSRENAFNHHSAECDEDSPEAKLRAEIRMKRSKVEGFFKGKFPVYLIHARDGRSIRVSTDRRVETEYTKIDLTIPVVTRLIL